MQHSVKTLLLTTLLASPYTFGANAATYDPLNGVLEETQSRTAKVTSTIMSPIKKVPFELILTIAGEYSTQFDTNRRTKIVKSWTQGYLSKAALYALARTCKKFYAILKPTFDVFNHVRHLELPMILPDVGPISPEVLGLTSVLSIPEGSRFDQRVSLIVQGATPITKPRFAYQSIKRATNNNFEQLKKLKAITYGLTQNAPRKEMIDAADTLRSIILPFNPFSPNHTVYISRIAKLYEKLASFRNATTFQIIESAMELTGLANLFPLNSPEKNQYASKATSLYDKAASAASLQTHEICSIAKGYLQVAEQYLPDSKEKIISAAKGLILLLDLQKNYRIDITFLREKAFMALQLANEIPFSKEKEEFASLLSKLYVALISQTPLPKHMLDLAKLYVNLAHYTTLESTKREYASKAIELINNLQGTDILEYHRYTFLLQITTNRQENIFIQAADLLISLIDLLPSSIPQNIEITNTAINFCDVYEEKLRIQADSLFDPDSRAPDETIDRYFRDICSLTAVLTSIAKQFPLECDQKDFYSSKAANYYKYVGYHGNEDRKAEASNGLSELAAIYPESHPSHIEYDNLSKISLTFYFDDQTLNQNPTIANIKYFAEKYVDLAKNAQLESTKYQYAAKGAELYKRLQGLDRNIISVDNLFSLMQLFPTSSPEHVALAKTAAEICDNYEEKLLRKADSLFWGGSIIDFDAFIFHLEHIDALAARYSKFAQQLSLAPLEKDLFSSKAANYYKYIRYYGNDVWKTRTSDGLYQLGDLYPFTHPKYKEYIVLSMTSLTTEFYIELLSQDPSPVNSKVLAAIYINLAHQAELESTKYEYAFKAIELLKNLQDTYIFKLAANSILSLMPLFPLGSQESIELANLAASSCEIYYDNIKSKVDLFIVNRSIVDIEALDYYLQDLATLAAQYRMIAHYLPLESDMRERYASKAADLYRFIGQRGNFMRKEEVYHGIYSLLSLYPDSHPKYQEYWNLLNTF